MEENRSTDSARDGEVTYAYKPSMMAGAHAFRLASDGLAWEVGRHAGKIPYRSIRRLRLTYRPVTLASHRFMAEIWAPGEPKLTVASTSWRSVVEQQRHDAEYATFMRALIARIGQAGGSPLLQTGSPPLLYWPGVVVCVVLAIGLPVMLFRAAQAGAFAGAAIVGGLLAVFVWQIGNFFWRNRPGQFRSDAIPPDLLPG